MNNYENTLNHISAIEIKRLLKYHITNFCFDKEIENKYWDIRSLVNEIVIENDDCENFEHEINNLSHNIYFYLLRSMWNCFIESAEYQNDTPPGVYDELEKFANDNIHVNNIMNYIIFYEIRTKAVELLSNYVCNKSAYDRNGIDIYQELLGYIDNIAKPMVNKLLDDCLEFLHNYEELKEAA